MLAWYFAPENNRLAYGDGRIIEVGKMHTIKGIPRLCEAGLHGSVNILDALIYAPSTSLYRVNITRKLDIGHDKICGQRREYLAHVDANNILWEFARKQALINISKIKPCCSNPEYAAIINWLVTGHAEYRSAAQSAVESAAWSSAESAARYAKSAANTMLTKMIEDALTKQGENNV